MEPALHYRAYLKSALITPDPPDIYVRSEGRERVRSRALFARKGSMTDVNRYKNEKLAARRRVTGAHGRRCYETHSDALRPLPLPRT